LGTRVAGARGGESPTLRRCCTLAFLPHTISPRLRTCLRRSSPRGRRRVRQQLRSPPTVASMFRCGGGRRSGCTYHTCRMKDWVVPDQPSTKATTRCMPPAAVATMLPLAREFAGAARRLGAPTAVLLPLSVPWPTAARAKFVGSRRSLGRTRGLASVESKRFSMRGTPTLWFRSTITPSACRGESGKPQRGNPALRRPTAWRHSGGVWQTESLGGGATELTAVAMQKARGMPTMLRALAGSAWSWMRGRMCSATLAEARRGRRARLQLRPLRLHLRPGTAVARRRSGGGWWSGQHSGGAKALIADAMRQATGKVATSEALATSARRWTREALKHGMPEKEAPDRQKKS
jgi:hypothetical protein